MRKRVSPRTGWPAVILRLALAQTALGIREQDYCNENREQALVLGMVLLIILLFCTVRCLCEAGYCLPAHH